MTETKLVRDLKKENLTNAIISLLGLAVTFAVAYGFDQWSELLRRQARANFHWAPYYWFLSVSNLFFACLMLLLAWFVCFRAKTRLVSILYLVFGLLGTFAFVSGFSISSTFQVIMPGFPLPNSRVFYISAFVAAIGIARFILSKFNHD